MSATARRTAALLLGATLVTLTATACNSTGGASVSTEAKQTASASTTKAADAPHAPAPAKVGDTIALKGMDKGNTADVTAVKVVDPAESASEYLKPADGKHYVAVQFQIKATGAQAYSEVPASSAKVVDTQGQAYGPNLEETKAGPAFQTPTNIAPGDTGKGFVTFEVPDGTKLDKVQFALDNGFSQQTGQWKIG